MNGVVFLDDDDVERVPLRDSGTISRCAVVVDSLVPAVLAATHVPKSTINSKLNRSMMSLVPRLSV